MLKFIRSINFKIIVYVLLATLFQTTAMRPAHAIELDLDHITLKGDVGIIVGNFPISPDNVEVTFSVLDNDEISSVQVELFDAKQGRYYGVGFRLSDYQEFLDQIVDGNVQIKMVVSQSPTQEVTGRLRWAVAVNVPGIPHGGDYIVIDTE